MATGAAQQQRERDALASDTEIAMLLGEMKGQLRELIHSVNNTAQKVDALALRVAHLEAEAQRRAGATGLGMLILKSPLVGWIIAAASAAWAILSGRAHP